MSAYHINPETGRAGKCVALEKCRYGEAAIHGPTLELARILYEESQAEHLLPPAVSRSFKQPAAKAGGEGPPQLTPTELELLSKRLKGQLLPSELKKLKVDGATEVEVVFNRNGTSSFDYRGEATQRTFTRGACALLAYAIHEKTGLPLAIFTKDAASPYWEGHVAVRLGPDEFLDVRGVSSKTELKREFASTKASKVQSTVTLAEFREAMNLGEGVDTYHSMGRLERAIIDRLARDLVRDFVALP